MGLRTKQASWGRNLQVFAGFLRLPRARQARWAELEPRPGDFGVEVPAITTEQLWQKLADFGVNEADLLKLDCEGAEYVILSELAGQGRLIDVGWIRGEWHFRKQNQQITAALAETHDCHIDPNEPHDVGLFIAHRKC